MQYLNMEFASNLIKQIRVCHCHDNREVRKVSIICQHLDCVQKYSYVAQLLAAIGGVYVNCL